MKYFMKIKENLYNKRIISIDAFHLVTLGSLLIPSSTAPTSLRADFQYLSFINGEFISKVPRKTKLLPQQKVIMKCQQKSLQK